MFFIVRSANLSVQIVHYDLQFTLWYSINYQLVLVTVYIIVSLLFHLNPHTHMCAFTRTIFITIGFVSISTNVILSFVLLYKWFSLFIYDYCYAIYAFVFILLYRYTQLLSVMTRSTPLFNSNNDVILLIHFNVGFP